jgi:hypothetical protein
MVRRCDDGATRPQDVRNCETGFKAGRLSVRILKYVKQHRHGAICRYPSIDSEAVRLVAHTGE